MTIIGCTGTMGSGKTTAAKYLVDKYKFVKIGFKDALLDEVKRNFPDLLQEICSYYTFKSTDDMLEAVPRPPLVRKLLQNYGTDVRRKSNPMYWVDRWTRIIDALPGLTNVVVDDVRFINEAERIMFCKGHIIRINGATPVNDNAHASEKEMAKIQANLNIANHTTKEDLYRTLDEFVLNLPLLQTP